MHDFHYRGEELYCEETPVATLAGAYGTPFYLYSLKTLTDHYKKLEAAFAPVDHMICYSTKANSNLAVLRALIRRGAGLDIVSEGELFRGQRAGVDPSKVVFAGVGKSSGEIAKALRAGIRCFTVESQAELALIEATARECGKQAPVSVRVNPGVNPHTHRYVATGKKESKFGTDLEGAWGMYRYIQKSPHLRAVGVQIHIGSQITQTAPFVRAIRKTRPFIEKLRKAGIALQLFDIGGGMGIVYAKEKPSTAAQFASAVLPELKDIGLKVVLEPGRFIAGNAGIFVCRVQFIKKVGRKNFVIVDGGMNDLIRPSLYDAYHEVLPVKKGRKVTLRADIVGPVCESGDFFAKDRPIARLDRGDLLAVMGAGAYGFTMASNYNSRPRPPEVLVDGARHHCIRERETLQSLVETEKIPAFLQ